jgi:hypothetical protein
MEVSRKGGNAAKAPADRFTGDVWLWPRIGATDHTDGWAPTAVISGAMLVAAANTPACLRVTLARRWR